MDLTNETPYPALLLRTIIDPQRIAAAVVARITYTFEGGILVPAPEQPWKVSPSPWDSPGGVMEADQPFRKGGIDVHLFGAAYAPRGKPAPSFELRIEVGTLLRRALITGERRWIEQGGMLVPSPPSPIASLPLSVEHAYGGEAEFDGLKVQYPDNPAGKGFYLEREQALEKPLPQIEDAEHTLKRWDERCESVCFGFCPFPSGPRLRASAVVTEGRLRRILPNLFNMASPRMVASNVEPGSRVCIHGVRPAGPLEFTVPESRLVVYLNLGGMTAERPLQIDQIGIEADIDRVFIGYRFPFRYVIHPEQARHAILMQRGG